ncbi:hypothetical protein DSM104299_05820 [Baekduia alba]|uniref:YciI family protein n=1 Tax=Baekduia alba TaxID=2997333 RepID=UPI002340E2B8|nr:YciI family protein [Baekduia alba]WCB97049.1 hypothetical protein DSM104299_05820 [Baekduia alba]
MFVLSLTYIVDLEEVDRVRDDHLAWISTQYEAGRFIASGPKVPRTGGVILAKAMPRDELDEVIASDPFTREGIATYNVAQFTATTTADELAALQERV